MAAHFRLTPGPLLGDLETSLELRKGAFRPTRLQIKGVPRGTHVPPTGRQASGKIRRSPQNVACPRRSVPGARRKRPPGRPNRHPGRGPRPSPAGGARGDEGHHSPQCRRIFSITSPCGGSMNATTFIWPPHLGQASGSISYTRLMSMAQVWLARLRAGAACGLAARPDARCAEAASAAALRRRPRALFEYQP